MSRFVLPILMFLAAADFVSTPVRAEHGGPIVIAQQEESDRKKTEEGQEAERRKRKEEDARFAPTCDPLKTHVSSMLESAGTVVGSFNKALAALREVEKKLPSSCPERIKIFGGSIVSIAPCYNRAIYVKLADGGAFVWTGSTRKFNYAPPQESRQMIMGVADMPYFCVSSIQPVIVWSGMHIGEMALRNWDSSDNDRLIADRARLRARELAELDRYIAELDPKIQRNANDADALTARGISYYKKGDYVRAITDFDKVTTLQPRNAGAWNNRCGTRAAANRELQQALADCNESLKLAPKNANALDSRAMTYLRLGELAKSIADYDAALTASPTTASSYYGRGLAKRNKGDRVGGDADIAKAREINIEIAEEFANYGLK